MPLYSFECHEHDEHVVLREMKDATLPFFCQGRQLKRIFSVPYYVEDRCRLARNPKTGEDFSDLLGQPYPKDRKERDAIYAARGIEPVTRSSAPAEWKQMAEYGEHIRTGGERIANEADLAPKPDLSSVKSVRQQLKESNVRLGVS